MDYDYLLKVITIGDYSTGKTSLIDAYCQQTRRVTASGCEFKVKIIPLDAFNVKLRLWDTCSQDRYGGLTRGYYRHAHICALVFDLTNAKSFENLCNKWYTELVKYSHELNEHHRVIVIGTKCNSTNIAVGRKLIDAFCIGHNFEYYAIDVQTYSSLEHVYDVASSNVVSKIDRYVDCAINKNRCY
jgi:small GTP-binding protein